jgi:hypothetical protein
VGALASAVLQPAVNVSSAVTNAPTDLQELRPASENAQLAGVRQLDVDQIAKSLLIKQLLGFIVAHFSLLLSPKQSAIHLWHNTAHAATLKSMGAH